MTFRSPTPRPFECSIVLFCNFFSNLTRVWPNSGFHAANGTAQHALMNDPVLCFFFLRGRERWFFVFFPWFSMILIMFCQGFPNVFPKMLPIAPGFYPIWFNSHEYKLKRWNLGECICFYFATGVPKRCWHALCAKKIADGPINITP
jgi:hypothetical protein